MKKLKPYLLAIAIGVLPATAQAREPGIQLFTQSEYPQHYCLALNIYFEARGSSLADRAAVANVVMNRVNDRRYPDTICSVVQQGNRDSKGNPVRNECQFSWYCDRVAMSRIIHAGVYDESMEVAKKVLLEGFRLPSLTQALYYHADYVSPGWKRERITKIGRHIFYK